MADHRAYHRAGNGKVDEICEVARVTIGRTHAKGSQPNRLYRRTFPDNTVMPDLGDGDQVTRCRLGAAMDGAGSRAALHHLLRKVRRAFAMCLNSAVIRIEIFRVARKDGVYSAIKASQMDPEDLNRSLPLTGLHSFGNLGVILDQ